MSKQLSDEEIIGLFKAHTGIYYFEFNRLNRSDIVGFARAAIQASRSPEWVEEIMQEIECFTDNWFDYAHTGDSEYRDKAEKIKQTLRTMLEGKE